MNVKNTIHLKNYLQKFKFRLIIVKTFLKLYHVRMTVKNDTFKGKKIFLSVSCNLQHNTNTYITTT